jgi:hypothetical protein
VRRAFDHLHAELSIGVGSVVPRYALWLRLRELGLDPETLDREQALAFCRSHARPFLADLGFPLAPRAARRIEKALVRFDPCVPTPSELIARL